MTNNLEYIIRKSKLYNLECEYVNEDLIKVYSPKFLFDSWLVKDNIDTIELLHLSKKNNIKKCSYHLHAVFKKRDRIRVLQRINRHNEYVAFKKNFNKMNLVDRVLNK